MVVLTFGGVGWRKALLPPTTMASQRPPEPTSIVSLVVQSKKALQDGESLCSRAHALSTSSAQTAFDLLALEAKVKWTTDAVIEQLKARLSEWLGD
jgi:hypothetical protein